MGAALHGCAPFEQCCLPITSSQCCWLQRDVVSSSWAAVHTQDTVGQEPAKAPHDGGMRISHPQPPPNPKGELTAWQQPVLSGTQALICIGWPLLTQQRMSFST